MPYEPHIETPPDSNRNLKGWTDTEIGEVPEFSSNLLYYPVEGTEEYRSTYQTLLYLKNLWVNRPSSDLISDEELSLLQKKIEVATLANILRIIGFVVKGPLNLTSLLRQVEDLYPGETLEVIRTAPRTVSPKSFAMTLENAQMRGLIRERERVEEDEEFIKENRLLEGKNLIFVNSLISKGISYGFLHFIDILKNLNKVSNEQLKFYLNNNFGFASAKVEDDIYFAEISDHIFNQILEYSKKDLGSNDNFVILISDDVIVNGYTIDAVIRRIVSKLEELNIDKEIIYSCIRKIVIDSSNCYLASCSEDGNKFIWDINEHPDYGRQSYRIEIYK